VKRVKKEEPDYGEVDWLKRYQDDTVSFPKQICDQTEKLLLIRQFSTMINYDTYFLVALLAFSSSFFYDFVIHF
jgi:hypothetical protein